MAVEGPQESFLTVAEVAEILRLNQQTVRNWIDAGTLPATRVGRRVRIKQSDLDLIVERGYSGPPSVDTSSVALSAEDFWGGEPLDAAEPSYPAHGSGRGREGGAMSTEDEPEEER
jgi:excisionase family DNA binding protein